LPRDAHADRDGSPCGIPHWSRRGKILMSDQHDSSFHLFVPSTVYEVTALLVLQECQLTFSVTHWYSDILKKQIKRF
jgi:hypothetical protein